jgi:hypothetical protein
MDGSIANSQLPLPGLDIFRQNVHKKPGEWTFNHFNSVTKNGFFFILTRIFDPISSLEIS